MDDNEILKGLADNPMLFDAVTKAILNKFTLRFDNYRDVSNEQLGAYARARLEGLQLVDEAMSEIARLRTVQDKPDTRMPAR